MMILESSHLKDTRHLYHLLNDSAFYSAHFFTFIRSILEPTILSEWWFGSSPLSRWRDDERTNHVLSVRWRWYWTVISSARRKMILLPSLLHTTWTRCNAFCVLHPRQMMSMNEDENCKDMLMMERYKYLTENKFSLVCKCFSHAHTDTATDADTNTLHALNMVVR